MSMQRQPAIYVPHGAGPCFFMDWDPPDEWQNLRAWLRAIPETLPEKPRTILCITAHWEAPAFTISSVEKPALLYDYYGFPPHTYALEWPVRGAPEVARRAAALLEKVGLPVALDAERGYDHGTFVPLMVAWPEADVPVVQMSLHASLDPALHIRAGKALARLRDEGVLIIGSGMSWHNMARYNDPAALAPSEAFDRWLTTVLERPDAEQRLRTLARWDGGPHARFAHPREEHLLPLMVAAGSAPESPGKRTFTDILMGVRISGWRFG